MIKTYIVILLLFLNLGYSQNTVPPVKKGGKGTMTINPDPNQKSNGNTGQKNSTNASNTGNQNSITIIIDHSGSMIGDPLNAAKNSSQILVDLIDLWGSKLFPNRIGNINFQYIQFGGVGEYNILHPLGKVNDPRTLRNSINKSSTRFGGTDFSSGIEPALKNLINKGFNNKTIFLTDAGDQGNGPNTTKDYYKDLNDTKFVIYGNKSNSFSNSRWLNTVPNASVFYVNNEYEVLSLFVKTLFEFVDDIDNYLVRQGSQYVDKGNSFNIIKHSKDKDNLLILSKPYNSKISIKEIIAPNGYVIPKNSYQIYDAKTFFNIELKNSLDSGEYKIIFENYDRSHNFFYINFEQCNIELNVSTLPQLNGNECFVENSSVNFDFKYWDIDQDIEVNYPDFLNHSAYHFVIENNVFDTTGNGSNGLSFSHSFPFGSAGSYQVKTSWSYNEKKMGLQNKPPLGLKKDFCISPNGSLVNIVYDTTQTWEGRQIKFKATIFDTNQYLNRTTKELFLKTGHETIVLEQDTVNKKIYNGILDYVKGNTQYTLALENRNPNIVYALDKNSMTSFYGKKREIIVAYEGKDYDFHKQKDISSFYKKLKYVFSSNNVPIKKYIFSGNNIAIPYYLPYYNEVNDQVKFSFRLNKAFPDEDVILKFKSDSTQCSYPQNDVKVNGLWGMFSSNVDYSDAVTVDLNLIDSIPLMAGGEAIQTGLVKKQKGEMFFASPLYKEPQFITNGSISLDVNGIQRKIILDNTDIRIDISTSKINKFSVLTKWGVYKILALLLIILLLIIYFILFMVSRQRCNQKVRLWKRLRDNGLLNLEDLWSESIPVRRCNKIFELPDVLKLAFLNKNKLPDKQIMLDWLEHPESKEIKSIKSKICYKSIYKKSKLPLKVLYIFLIPITLLIDLIINAFQLDKKTIKDKPFLKYVSNSIENANIYNMPSEWFFNNVTKVYITYNDKDNNAIRLRHLNYQTRMVEITIHNDYCTVQSLGPSLDIRWSNASAQYVSSRKSATSPNYSDNFSFNIDEEILIEVFNINYDELSCNIKCQSIISN